MLNECNKQIKVEIANADFISVIADKATDVSNKFHLVVVLRYILSNGKPVERFWKFCKPLGHDALSLSGNIKEVLAEVVSNKEKLVSQSYDGANVMSGQHAGVQTIIRKEYPYIYFIHCYARQLNLILAQAAS